MSSSASPPTCPSALEPAAPLLYTPREAARLLSVSMRTLWGLTKERRIPHLVLASSTRKVKDRAGVETERLVELIRYPAEGLAEWVRENTVPASVEADIEAQASQGAAAPPAPVETAPVVVGEVRP